jgi:hypothetical protein
MRQVANYSIDEVMDLYTGNADPLWNPIRDIKGVYVDDRQAMYVDSIADGCIIERRTYEKKHNVRFRITGHNVAPSRQQTASEKTRAAARAEGRAINASAFGKPLFDENYYHTAHHVSAVSAIGETDLLLAHYCEEGWKKGYNPSAAFNTNAYLNDYPDVRAAGLNPLWHYVAHGKADGRTIRPVGGAAVQGAVPKLPGGPA